MADTPHFAFLKTIINCGASSNEGKIPEWNVKKVSYVNDFETLTPNLE